MDAQTKKEILYQKRRAAALKSAEVRRGKRAKKDLEKVKVQAKVDQKIMQMADKLISSQAVSAFGYYKMVTITVDSDGHKSVETIRDEKEFDRLLEEGELGQDYFIVAAKDPDAKSAEMLLNRALGKAVEKLELSGDKDKPLVVLLDT